MTEVGDQQKTPSTPPSPHPQTGPGPGSLRSALEASEGAACSSKGFQGGAKNSWKKDEHADINQRRRGDLEGTLKAGCLGALSEAQGHPKVTFLRQKWQKQQR